VLYIHVHLNKYGSEKTTTATKENTEDSCELILGREQLLNGHIKIFDKKLKVYNFLLIVIYDWHSGGWSPIGSNRHCGQQWLVVPAPGDYDDEEIGGMIGRGTRSTRRKPTPVPL
jgi:hypothetical protein